MTLFAALAALAWVAVLLLPWQPWRNRELLPARADLSPELSDVAVLIPARNEAETLPETLAAVLASPGVQLRVVDDGSDDGTAEVARVVMRRHPGADAKVVEAPPLPEGWSGKVWAQHHGLQHTDRPFVLLLDADIVLASGMLASLRHTIEARPCDMVSIMATLPMEGVFERWLLPPFVYFFKLLYPFALSNASHSRIAAAAGGCILVRRDLLDEAGGFEAIRDALIDDCTLAARLKRAGGRLWTGQSLDVTCNRRYDGLAPIWQMVSRTAFTQLRTSWIALALVSALMLWLFVLPLCALVAGDAAAASLGALALAAMMTSFLPCLLLHGRHPLWALTLPVAASAYLAMTWTSAWYWLRGRRAHWRGRSYASEHGSSRVRQC